jgi:L-asparaginase II
MGNPGTNPTLVELTRGRLVESVHAGSLAVARADGGIVASIGDIARPVFPRSAVKPLQAVALAASGAVERFALGAPELAISCGSHSGTERHVRVVAAMLERAGLTPTALLCGAHEPLDAAAARQLIGANAPSTPLHNNCSGKHAGMLLTAVHYGEPTDDYWRVDHPVQVRIRAILEELARCRLGEDVCGIDGCSVPNWAMPLGDLAAAYARFATGQGLAAPLGQACRRLIDACWSEPELVAGPGRLDTRAMATLAGEVLMKGGAEGVYCGALPALALGFALKLDDGAKRAAETAVVALIGRFYPEAARFGPEPRLTNLRGLEVGRLSPSAALLEGLAPLSEALVRGPHPATPPME